MPQIFISHASADKPFVDKLVERLLLMGSGVPVAKIFYSSGEDTGVPSGADLMAFVRDKSRAAGLVVAVVSPTYQTRPVCIAELGAAWAAADTNKLFPLLVPGMPRSKLEGVLPSLAIRPLDDSAVLDELHEALTTLLGITVKPATWGKHKELWRAEVAGLAKGIAVPPTVDPAAFEGALKDLEAARGAIADLNRENEELKEQLEALAATRPVAEVAKIRLPKGDRARFDRLVTQARRAISECPRVVQMSFWYDATGQDMPWPSPFDDSARDDINEAVEEGWLQENNEGLRPSSDFAEVAVAQEAIAELRAFLSDMSEELAVWFQTEYGRPLDLDKKAVWNQLLS